MEPDSWLGDRILTDRIDAARLKERAETGDPGACGLLGDWLLEQAPAISYGTQSEVEREENERSRAAYLRQAALWHRRAAESGWDDGLWRWGWRLWRGEGVEQDKQQAVKAWQEAAVKGHAAAKLKLLDLHVDFCELEDLRDRAEDADPAACHELGDEFLARAPGITFDHDLTYARDHLAHCEYILDGEIHSVAEEGAIRVDPELYRGAVARVARLERALRRQRRFRRAYMREAAFWHRRAAELGSPEGMWRWGWRLWLGEGVERDTHQAVNMWRLAAMAGHEAARVRLTQA